jgi:tRNA pseudouridine13 synthase
MQRFGTSTVPTHVIGLALLRSDWDLAVELILRPREGEDEDMLAGRKAWMERKDAKEALDKIPRRAVAERCGATPFSHCLIRGRNGTLTLFCVLGIVLESFLKSGDDRNKSAALASVSSFTAVLPLQFIISEIDAKTNADPKKSPDDVRARVSIVRLELCPIGEDSTIRLLPARPRGSRLRGKRSECAHCSARRHRWSVLGCNISTIVDSLMTSVPSADAVDDSTATQEPAYVTELKATSSIPRVKVLGESDVASGSYSIADVVLPLAGFNITYPSGTLGERYRNLLKADGLDIDNLVRKQK